MLTHVDDYSVHVENDAHVRVSAVTEVDVRFDGPEDSALRLVLAHGAGAGMDAPFMVEVAQALAARGVRVVRFEFPYMQRRRAGVTAAPDRLRVLIDAWHQAVARLGPASQLFIGGKSMGGRIATMVADQLGARGLVCFGYPFHPVRRPEQRRTAHLKDMLTPCLIVQGTRDPFGTRQEVSRYKLSRAIRIAWIEDADHSLLPSRRSGRDPTAARTATLSAVEKFMHGLTPGAAPNR